MDPDAEFNRLRESLSEKKDTKSKGKKVCLLYLVDVMLPAMSLSCRV